MIVECPACRTRYRTQALGAVDETTFFECTRAHCGHVFPSAPPTVQVGLFSEPSADAQPPATDGEPPASVQNALDFRPEADAQPNGTRRAPTFRRKNRKRGNGTADDTPSLFAHAASQNGATSQKGAAARMSRTQPEAPVGNGHVDNGGELPEATTPPTGVRPWVSPAPASDARLVSYRSVIGLIAAVVAGWAVVSLIAVSNIADTAATVSRLPLLGPLLDAEQPSARHVALTKMRGNFWRTKDGHRVFAIAGTAMNEADSAAQRIRIQGRLLDANGRVLEQREIDCGTDTAPEVLESLSLREVRILQNLAPPKRFFVPGGQSVEFLMTFLEPPDQVAEFSGRVVETRFGRS